MLVKVDKFIFSDDVIVLDIEEDNDFPIIVERLFLATWLLIDVAAGEFIMMGEWCIVLWKQWDIQTLWKIAFLLM